MGWKHILDLSAEELTEQEKDELFPTVIWFDVEKSKVNFTQMTHIFKVGQEILKYKGEQVETLILELDDLAAKQGEEEAMRRTFKSKQPTESDDELDNLKVEYAILLKKCNELERSHVTISDERIMFTQRIESLERDKTNLQAELQEAQQDDHSERSSPELQTNHQRAMVESLQQKNKHITQLLCDVEIVEKENVLLMVKLTTLRDELVDATSCMNQTTDELKALKLSSQHQAEHIENLEQQNTALRSQIAELARHDKQREVQIDDFSVALDRRIDEWKAILEQKTTEIEHWKTRYNDVNCKLLNGCSSDRIPELVQIIAERDQKIEGLQDHLRDATDEMNETVKIIEQLKADQDTKNNNSDESKTISDLQYQLKHANELLAQSQASVVNAEEDLSLKAKEVSQLIIQLQQLERGEFGLSEAIASMHELQNKVNVRDKQILELVQTLNKLKSETEHLEEQNFALRQQLGLSDSPIRTDGIASKLRQHQKLMNKLQAQLEMLEEDKLQNRLQNRHLNRIVKKLTTQIIELGCNPNLDVDEDEADAEVDVFDKNNLHKISAIEHMEQCHNEKLQDLVVENEALRKGLHEVLQSIHDQNGQTKIEVKSQNLDRLLKALDIRHVAGWYTPAMRLQAEVHALQGGNAELRDQLRTTKLETQASIEKLQKVTVETTLLQKEYRRSSRGNTPRVDVAKDLEIKFETLPNTEVLSKMHLHLLQALNEHHVEKQNNARLTETLENYRKHINMTRHQIGLLYKQYSTEKENWTLKLTNNETTIRELTGRNEILETQLSELKVQISEEIGSTGENLDTKEKYLSLIEELITLRRKCSYLLENENIVNNEVLKLKQDNIKCEIMVKQRMNNLRKQVDKAVLESTCLKLSLKEMVPINQLKSLEKELLDMTLKYRQILEKSNYPSQESQTNHIALLNTQIDCLKSEKEELNEKLLVITTERNNIREFLRTKELHNDVNALAANSFAEIESQLITETQRANHFSNLYQLVEEQLRNSEDRRSEIESNNNLLKVKNIELQSSVIDLQDKLINAITEETHNEIKEENVRLSNNLSAVRLEVMSLQESIILLQQQNSAYKDLKFFKEELLTTLQHQIVDLQSNSDEKATIARLSAELEIARRNETDNARKCNVIQGELDVIEMRNTNMANDSLQNGRDDKRLINDLKIKCRNLQNVIFSLRRQYAGGTPLATSDYYVSKLQAVRDEKQLFDAKLNEIKQIENEMKGVKDELFVKLELTEELRANLEQTADKNAVLKIMEWQTEKSTIILNELKSRRGYEYKSQQFQQALETIQKQENEIINLEEQLIRQHDHDIHAASIFREVTEKPKIISCDISVQTCPKQMVHKTINTNLDPIPESASPTQIKGGMDEERDRLERLLTEKSAKLHEYENQVTELEMLVHNFRKNLVLQQEEALTKSPTKSVVSPNGAAEGVTEQISSMKAIIINLQSIVNQRDESIIQYQAMLKDGRDEHSRAATRMHEEVQKLQAALLDQQHASLIPITDTAISPTTSENIISQKAIDHYVGQVHELEAHVGELHTAVRLLDMQLTASRQEAVRWRSLSDNRLYTMDQLRSKLEEQHQSEIISYKKECEKWRDEAGSLRTEISKLRVDANEEDASISKVISEKDTKIFQMDAKVKELEKKISVNAEKLKAEISPLEAAKRQLQLDHETLKKQLNMLKTKEKEAREEIRTLRGQLINRPILSSRSDRAGNRFPMREQKLQKKVAALETELEETKLKLDREIAINYSRRAKNAEELALWDKQKRWQQLAEKLKEKLKTKSDEVDRLQQAYLSSKTIISRFEREKNVLETKLKSAKESNVCVADNRIELLEHENARLQMDLEALGAKLQMSQIHSGDVGVTMLHEKLEAQERKIAVLELTSKGTVSVTDEIERLQKTNNFLQKENIRLEATNLELKLDIEKIGTDTPRLRDQVEHLQKYVEILKSERSQSSGMSENQQFHVGDQKKVSELEKTLFVLKRVIEKLQAENKRLMAGKSVPHFERRDSVEKYKSEMYRLREQYKESLQKSTRLEQELIDARKHIALLEDSIVPEKPDMSSQIGKEMADLRLQLKQKSDLLDKVKVLLHRAAAKEKALDEQVKTLKTLIPGESSSEPSST